MQPLPYQPIQYTRYANHRHENAAGGIITEASVDMTVNGQPWISFACTPSLLEELAAGFLFNEGIIQSPDEIEILRPCDNGSNIDVWLNHAVEKPTQWRRTSGCTGGMTTVTARERIQPLATDDPIAISDVLSWMEHLLEGQELYREVRGVHSSLLTDGSQVLAQAEDIGRHNTLDKIAGLVLLNRIHGGRRMIVTTGRVSSEMLQKSARIGASILVSRTSPTSMSMELAEEYGITLIGYARRNQCNVYTHPERLILVDRQSEQPLHLVYPLAAD